MLELGIWRECVTDDAVSTGVQHQGVTQADCTLDDTNDISGGGLQEQVEAGGVEKTKKINGNSS
jgi:hypothetical protein